MSYSGTEEHSITVYSNVRTILDICQSFSHQSECNKELRELAQFHYYYMYILGSLPYFRSGTT